MPKLTALTEDQRQTISFGLRVAAERFDVDAKCMREPPVTPQHDMLARQFDRQAKEARDMADLIDNAESISLEASVLRCEFCGEPFSDDWPNVGVAPKEHHAGCLAQAHGYEAGGERC